MKPSKCGSGRLVLVNAAHGTTSHAPAGPSLGFLSRSRTAAGSFEPGGGLVEDNCEVYLASLYTRSPASFFEDSIWTPCFLPAVEMKPRTLCACQSVAFMISARVAPLARPIISRIFAPLLSARGALLAGAVDLAA